jgi:hypothetical protein
MIPNGLQVPKPNTPHHVHSSFEKSLIEGKCSISRIGQKDLMTTFHVE